MSQLDLLRLQRSLFLGVPSGGVVSGYGGVSTGAITGYGAVTPEALSGYGTASTGSLVGASGVIATGTNLGYAGYGTGNCYSGYGKREADADAYYGFGVAGHASTSLVTMSAPVLVEPSVVLAIHGTVSVGSRYTGVVVKGILSSS